MIGMTLTWLIFGVVLALFGARAWVVETTRGRLSNGGVKQRGLTAAVVGSMVLLVLMAMFNGGFELISLLANGQNDVAAPAADNAPVVPGGQGAPVGQGPLVAPGPGTP